jgi:hypothetical protein
VKANAIEILLRFQTLEHISRELIALMIGISQPTMFFFQISLIM